MSMPMFSFEQDPGANFGELLKRVGLSPFGDSLPVSEILVPHATTCVALRCSNGVVMAGDRRATSGNLISHREMEKVVQADQFSGVAIAGAAGPAMEMVKLFQLQIEHYGRLWNYDATGGRYEEHDFVATGSGMLHAGTVLRMGWKRDMTVEEGVVLTARALWEASVADSATGGPDALRGIYPVIASITSNGFARIDDLVLKSTYDEIAKGVGQQ